MILSIQFFIFLVPLDLRASGSDDLNGLLTLFVDVSLLADFRFAVMS